MENIDYEELDPGIRKLVKLLRDHGFDTTDSGDGVSKFEDIPEDVVIEEGSPPIGLPGSCAEPVPNVYIHVSPGALLSEGDRLANVLRRWVKPGLLEETFIDPGLDQEVPKVIIEATYLPLEGTAILAVHGLADCDLIDFDRLT